MSLPIERDDVQQELAILLWQGMSPKLASVVAWRKVRGFVVKGTKPLRGERIDVADVADVADGASETIADLPAELQTTARCLADGMTQAETAIACGVSQPAIAKRVTKIREILECRL